MKTHRRPGAMILFAAVVYVTQSGYDSCSGEILHDSGFDMWCGEELCSWKVERGTARKAPTWHRADAGVDMIGDDVVLTQRSNVDGYQAPCVRFELVADIAEDALVTLEMDLFADGEVDYERQLPTSEWAPLVYVAKMPGSFQGILFRLRKSGGGRAVLAQISARSIDVAECAGAVELEQPPVPPGGACYSNDPDDPFAPDDDLCGSGRSAVTRPGAYLPYACGDCATDDDCGGEACGVESRVAPFLDPHRACVAPASRVLGELCFGGAECATGVCCEGVCSACCDGDGCGEGRRCTAFVLLGAPPQPHQCDGGDERGESGEPCLIDEDCASGDCAGGEELHLCGADGRRCERDSDCPPDALQEEAGDELGTCVLVGTAGGSCE
jgi:hypothetical protein